MILRIKVKPASEGEEIIKTAEGEYTICVKERAEDGRANKAVVNLLAHELGVSFRCIKIKNPTSRNKIVEVKRDEV